MFKSGKPSTLCFLRRLHHLALSAGWITVPIVAPNLWPKYKPKERRGITRDEHEAILARERNAEWKLYLELLWETGAAQADAANFKAEDIDWPTRTLSYLRKKTGSLAQFTISTALEKVLQQLPTTGALFPNLSTRPSSVSKHRLNRGLPTAAVLNLLRTRLPEQYGLAEVVGKWVWLDVSPARQPMLAKLLWTLGFHWNQRRGVWQHPCGSFNPLGSHPTDPRAKYRSYFPADVMPA